MNRRTPVFIAILMFLCCVWPASVGFAAENRGHAAPPNLLPKDLTNVAVNDYFIPSSAKEAGVIQTVMAHVVVARGDDLRQAYFAANGDKLYEQDIVFTLKNSKCRIKLHNDDIITIGDDTRLSLKEAVGTRDAPDKKSVLSLVRGKAMFYAIRLLRHKNLNMTVETPTAVAGVRGTKFGVEVNMENGRALGARPLLIADASADWGRHLLLAQAAQSPGGTTAVHGFDGAVAVTSKVTGATTSVGAGETLTSGGQGLGAVLPTPPQVSQSFQSATNVPPPGGGGGQEGGSGGGQDSGAAPAAPTGGGSTEPSTPDTSTLTQNQNTSQVEPPAPPTGPTGQYGYFTGMLDNGSGGYGGYVDTYMSNSLQDFRSGNASAKSSDSFSDTKIDGRGQTKGMVELSITETGTWGGNETVTFAQIGSNAFMEWGTWAQANPMGIIETSYFFNNNGAYVWGDYTTDPQMATLNARTWQGLYSGAAWGTYFVGGGPGTSMGGTFSSTVNFGATPTISDFNVNVSGGVYSVEIIGATGSFNPTTSSNFTITPGSGTWKIFNGPTPTFATNKGASGSVYGSNGEAIGGVWKAGTAQGQYTVGGFQGTR